MNIAMRRLRDIWKGEKMKSIQEQVYDYICENPQATYGEIEETLGLKSDARVHIWRLKKKGVIQGENGKGYEIIEPFIPFVRAQNKDVYLEMIEIYMEDFRESENFSERVTIGKEIRLLLDKVE